MPVDDIYWNSIDFGSEEEESILQEMPSSVVVSSAKNYVDPWDLENYAYIKEHLDSIDLNSDPSSGEFITEANSTSFYYVPGNQQQQQQQQLQLQQVQQRDGNYADIDEIRPFVRRGGRNVYSDIGYRGGRNDSFESDFDESPYEENLKDSSLIYVQERKDRWRRANPTLARDRSLSFSYGDFGHDPYGVKQQIYSRLDELQKDSTIPIYDDVRNVRRKPRNFGLSNYGHLKIDYSYSWNNLDKYICN